MISTTGSLQYLEFWLPFLKLKFEEPSLLAGVCVLWWCRRCFRERKNLSIIKNGKSRKTRYGQFEQQVNCLNEAKSVFWYMYSAPLSERFNFSTVSFGTSQTEVKGPHPRWTRYRDQKQPSPVTVSAVMTSAVWRNWQLISWYHSCLTINSPITIYYYC